MIFPPISHQIITLVDECQEEEELLAYWWKEYAECSKGPSGPGTSDSGVRSDDPYVVEEERVGVPVKGGLFEVFLLSHFFWTLS